MGKSVQELIDEAEIRDVHLRYCRGVDRLDWDLVRSCFHPDAIDDHGDYVGDVEGFIAWARQGVPFFTGTSHFTGNQLVMVDGDQAWAEHYVVSYHRCPARDGQAAADLTALARYVDRLERRAGEWRIIRRLVIIDTDRSDAAPASWAPASLLRGRRGTDDPSYQLR